MEASATSISYASYTTPLARPWSRAAVALALGAVVQPALSFGLLFAVHRGWLPPHFLCCKHPEFSITWFAAVPAAGFFASLLTCNHLVRRRSILRGWMLMVLAGAAFALLVPVGLLILSALKM